MFRPHGLIWRAITFKMTSSTRNSLQQSSKGLLTALAKSHKHTVSWYKIYSSPFPNSCLHGLWLCQTLWARTVLFQRVWFKASKANLSESALRSNLYLASRVNIIFLQAKALSLRPEVKLQCSLRVFSLGHGNRAYTTSLVEFCGHHLWNLDISSSRFFFAFSELLLYNVSDLKILWHADEIPTTFFTPHSSIFNNTTKRLPYFFSENLSLFHFLTLLMLGRASSKLAHDLAGQI